MMKDNIKGRGAADNPANRFEPIYTERDSDWTKDDPAPSTQFYRDATRTILTKNDSPDVPFTFSLNPYRGCEHGCVYCYARPTHEYMGLSAGLDFETKIFVKEKAPALLRAKLASRDWVPQAVAISGVTDAYQPIERRLRLTRRCLEVFAEFGNPVAIITKSRLITRDVDILGRMAKANIASVYISVTTLDETVRWVMEPRASTAKQRLEAIKTLAGAGVPVGVLIAPVIPGLTDHEIPAIIEACSKAGARFAGYVPLRLPHGVAQIFEDWLSRRFPHSKKKVLNQIRSLHGGKLNDPRFGSRMRGQGVFAEEIKELFRIACNKYRMDPRGPELSARFFKRSKTSQLELTL